MRKHTTFSIGRYEFHAVVDLQDWSISAVREDWDGDDLRCVTCGPFAFSLITTPPAPAKA